MIEVQEHATETGMFSVVIDEGYERIIKIFEWFSEHEIELFEPFDGKKVTVDKEAVLGLAKALIVWNAMPFIRLKMKRDDALRFRLYF